MNQFKDVLLGLEKRSYQRAASVQKCVRAGGKHNDLDEVGKDGRHLTFFEMLGNWSFGEYYKREAIRWAWEYLTTVLNLPAERLYVSVYRDDDESWDLWNREMGLPPEKIVRLGHVEAGDEENFWSMGPTGPCGPCTEIYYDHHPEAGKVPWEPGFDGERFCEIWNLVFMEFNRDETGELEPLPMQSVDTGMGLDRVAAILAGEDNVFRTGLFAAILERTWTLLHGDQKPASFIHSHPDFISFCVIADHIRTVGFSVCDGATFSNEGRGYVLRRILRRAVRHGRNMGFTGPFLYQVLDALVASFQHAYPELRLKHREAATIIRTEEERFFRTLDRGIALFDEVASSAQRAGLTVIDGDAVFKLYDTFGFPPDLTEIMAEERGLKIDEHGYQRAMQEQRERSRSADERYADAGEWRILQDGAADTFIGYDRLEALTDVLRYRLSPESGTIELCLRETPFYAESGGQVGDQGMITTHGGTALRVTDTIKTTAGITHICELSSGELSEGDLRHPVAATVNGELRHLAACNHTATHLLHAALHRFVSPNAFQAGSLVSSEKLRFDFSLDQPVTRAQLLEMESWVNDQIRRIQPVRIHLNVALADAEGMGAMMIFGEKYGERVRVVEVPGTSTELCGGIHVRETSEISYFRILGETGVAAGVRRIEAVTNLRAFDLARHERETLEASAGLLRCPAAQVNDRIERLLQEQKALQQRIEELVRAQSLVSAASIVASAIQVGPFNVASAQVHVSSRDELMQLVDFVRDRLGAAAVVGLGTVLDEKPTLVVACTDAAVAAGLKAGDLVGKLAQIVDGKGGGKPTLAQAGGRDTARLPEAVQALLGLVQAQVN
jgi:alanyl-tRNA synthetase